MALCKYLAVPEKAAANAEVYLVKGSFNWIVYVLLIAEGVTLFSTAASGLATAIVFGTFAVRQSF